MYTVRSTYCVYCLVWNMHGLLSRSDRNIIQQPCLAGGCRSRLRGEEKQVCSLHQSASQSFRMLPHQLNFANQTRVIVFSTTDWKQINSIRPPRRLEKLTKRKKYRFDCPFKANPHLPVKSEAHLRFGFAKWLQNEHTTMHTANASFSLRGKVDAKIV